MPADGPRVYIHELVDVVGTQRARYQHHMTANWVPDAATYRRQRCFGVFTLVGSTGRWPQVVNMWEFDSWADLAHDFSIELGGPSHRDPTLEQWWAQAASFRSGGLDRILVAHPDSPGAEDWHRSSGTGAVAYVHEVLRTEPGAAPALADRIAAEGLDGSAADDLFLVGLFRTAMRNDDEVVCIRGLPSWDAWARFENGMSAPGRVPVPVRTRERVLLVDAEFSPLRIGRQPTVADRRPLDEV